MKHLKYLVVIVLAVLMSLPVLSACAPAPSPTPTPTPGLTPTPAEPVLPAVPITYPSDTDATIIRRAEWVEGAKKEGRLVWWATLTPAQGEGIIAEFNKIYPFIKVDFWRGKGEEIATKLEAEFAAGRYAVDVTEGGESSNYPRWREMGMMVKLTDIIPGMEKLDPRMLGEYGDLATAGSIVTTPQYNTNLVSAAEAPKSWEDLLDPKWKGHIGLSTDVKWWAAIAVAEGGWGIAKTEDFLTKLAQQDLIWGQGHTAVHALMIAGEFGINAEGYLYHVFNSQDKGAPVEWVRANPVIIGGTDFSLKKKAPHPNAARLFIEWMFSPQGLLVHEEVTQKGSAFPDAGTRQSKALEGVNFVKKDEGTELEVLQLGLEERLAGILGIR